MITKAERRNLTDAMAIAMVDYVRDQLDPIQARLGALERDRQERKGGPPPLLLPAPNKPRVRVPAISRQL